MAKKVKCEDCNKVFYVNRVKRLGSKIKCNSCVVSTIARWEKYGYEAYSKYKLYDNDIYNKYLTEINFTPPDIFKTKDFKAAYQSDAKIDSRELITNFIKRSFPPNMNLSLVELLGAGVGALYYGMNLPINRMLLIEKNKKAYNDFYSTSYKEFCQTFPNMAIELFNVDIIDHIRNHCGYYWNIVNLDFCAYCYSYHNRQDGSPLSTIEEFFRQKRFANNAVLLTTFQLEGSGVRCGLVHNNKTIYKTEESIVIEINRIARRHGFLLQKNFSNIYNPNNYTKMINLGFKILREM